jgi:hypothetical protein
MASSTIRIKRTSTTAVTGSILALGELGYSSVAGTQSNTGDRLYIGLGASDQTSAPVLIGGKYFTDMLDHVAGTLTASSALLVDANSKIDNINVGNITITGSTGIISSTNEDGNITLAPNGNGYVVISGTNGLVIPVGTTAQQGPSTNGAIRYNTETTSFEGYSSGNWASLGGVRSVDQLTYIVAESAPGVSDDTLHFYASNNTTAVEVAKIDVTALKILASTDNDGDATSGALQVAGGVGIAKKLYVGNSLTVAGTSSFTELATFNKGLVISGDTNAASEYLRITNGDSTPVTTFLVDSSSGNTTIAGTLGVGGTANVTGNFSVDTTKFTVMAASGNTTVGGTLGVSGTTTLSGSLGVTGAATFSSTANVTSDFSVNTNKFTVTGTSGDTAIAGTLGVTGAATLSDKLDLAGNLSINTDKFTVTAANGNTSVGGTLDVSGNFAINNNKFTVAKTTGNTAIAGTLNVTGATTFTGALGVNNDFAVSTDKFTVASATGNTAVAGTLTVTGETSLNAALSMNGFGITNLAEPTQSTDAVNKAYVDSLSAGLHIHQPVDFASTTDLATTTGFTVAYVDGTVDANDKGKGSQLTFTGSGNVSFTTYNAALGGNETATFATHSNSRVLVIGQTDQKQNGIYVWSGAKVFTRASDADASYEKSGLTASITSGESTITLTSTAGLKVGMPVFKLLGTGTLASGVVIISEINSSTQVTVSTAHVGTGTITLAFGYGDLGGGDFVFVSDTGHGYVQVTEGAIFGVSNIVWSQFAGAGSWTAGAGIALNATQFSINLATNSGLNTTSGLAIDSTIAGNGLSFANGVITAVGTSNRISISSGGIDIASTYIGQTSITTLGTITTGTWSADTIATNKGGTGITSYTAGDILYADATGALTKLAKGAEGTVLKIDSGLPVWSEIDGGTF